jgi:hypothetical protein
LCAEKDKDKFRVGPASSYPAKQTGSGLTIAVVPFTTAEQARPPFGKVNPYEHGVLPVLIVMQNDSGKALRMDRMEVHYVTRSRRTVVATPAGDVPYLQGAQRPNMGGSPIPYPLPRRKKNNKLAIPEIEGLAFNAKMLPAGDSAHGFVYFQTALAGGSHIYIRGIVEAPTGQELLFFEIPLE